MAEIGFTVVHQLLDKQAAANRDIFVRGSGKLSQTILCIDTAVKVHIWKRTEIQ